MKYSRDIQSLSVFKRDSAKFLKQLKRTKEPIVLTVNGQAAAIVMDPDSYEDYRREKDRQETIAGVRRGIEAMKAGRVRDAEEVFREIEKRFNIPSEI